MLLNVQNIEKSFDNIKIINNISFDLYKGKFLTIIGPSGSGKSTIFNILSGILKCDKGVILKNNLNITNKTGFVGYMQQNDLLLPWFNVLDNVSIPLILKGIKKSEAYKIVTKYFSEFCLSEYIYYFPEQLSGGLRQRVSLLRTFMISSDLILLDEPFSRLDAITKMLIQNWFKDFIEKTNISCILVTHDIDEAIFMSDEIYVITDKPATIQKKFQLTNIQKNTNSKEFYLLKENILKCLVKNV